MNVQRAPEWLPSFLVPFITLSYPIDPPAEPDSFVNSHYYSTGLLDGCLIISYIAVMAVLRDVVRVYILEPFACWILTRNSRNAKKRVVSAAIGAANGVSTGIINGTANGGTVPHGNGSANGHTNGSHAGTNGNGVHKMGSKEKRQLRKSVLRFAEQGWALTSYTINWAFGLVR
jgi:acyl-CoA-dependent ceramide synthase